jgi:divinyl chlorophyllide a 8-vinyl-reductase
MRQQGELVADVLGKEEAKLLGVPIGIFDVIVNGLQGAADTASKAASFDGFPDSIPQWARERYQQTMAAWAQSLEDSAEFGRIGRYYAVEDMLTTDPADKYGRTTLRQHYERIAVEGQEYDPYTSVFGSKASKEAFQEAAK